MRDMEIGGLLNARTAVSTGAHLRHLQHQMHMDPHSAYSMHQPPLSHHQHSLSQPNSMGFAPLADAQQQLMATNYMSSHNSMSGHDSMDPNASRPKTEPAPKAFACSTCAKGFARRSDLARHERIHSGVRPHACDHPGCGKQFIQRSALTVHARVHTGEKPHMCERCGKPFSDSSSLARHRRIHSGKRPYKCPYANCQKTFTRRTTLTRHQNHHTGTVEQAQAETNAKLSMTQPQGQPQSASGSFSDGPSPTSTTSLAQGMSGSPTHDMSSIPGMPPQNTEYQYMTHQNQPLPGHMRANFQHMASRAGQPMTNPPISAYGATPHQRMAMGMPPHAGNTFGPPQPMEPATSRAGNGSGSPHMPGMTWSSPNNAVIAAHHPADAFVAYQDPSAYGGQYMYGHPNSNVRRPQSTEPDDYGVRSRTHLGHHLAAGNMGSIPDWNSLPMQERTFTMSH